MGTARVMVRVRVIVMDRVRVTVRFMVRGTMVRKGSPNPDLGRLSAPYRPSYPYPSIQRYPCPYL